MRRAWIEIPEIQMTYMSASQSLSVRRAWIEMLPMGRTAPARFVALREESVD